MDLQRRINTRLVQRLGCYSGQNMVFQTDGHLLRTQMPTSYARKPDNHSIVAPRNVHRADDSLERKIYPVNSAASQRVQRNNRQGSIMMRVGNSSFALLDKTTLCAVLW